MPRGEYERHHKRDKDGNYAGTEPRQDWDDAMIASAYGRYQHATLGGAVPKRGDAVLTGGSRAHQLPSFPG